MRSYDGRKDEVPRIVNDGEGLWVTVWNAGGYVVFSTSTDAGESWSEASGALNPISAKGDMRPQLETDQTGSWVAVWLVEGSAFYDTAVHLANGVSCSDEDQGGYSTDGPPCGEIDCDDSNPDVNPGVTEICNGIDDNCDGNIDDVDEDGDGYVFELCIDGFDYNDDPSADPVICGTCSCGVIECAPCARCQHPGAVDFQGDGIDSDCDGSEPPWAPASTLEAMHKNTSDAVNALFMLLLPLFAVLFLRRNRIGR